LSDGNALAVSSKLSGVLFLLLAFLTFVLGHARPVSLCGGTLEASGSTRPPNADQRNDSESHGKRPNDRDKPLPSPSPFCNPGAGSADRTCRQVRHRHLAALAVRIEPGFGQHRLVVRGRRHVNRRACGAIGGGCQDVEGRVSKVSDGQANASGSIDEGADFSGLAVRKHQRADRPRDRRWRRASVPIDDDGSEGEGLSGAKELA
jgi:hypothetical protein